jgi:hypothetical protein
MTLYCRLVKGLVFAPAQRAGRREGSPSGRSDAEKKGSKSGEFRYVWTETQKWLIITGAPKINHMPDDVRFPAPPPGLMNLLGTKNIVWVCGACSLRH